MPGVASTLGAAPSLVPYAVAASHYFLIFVALTLGVPHSFLFYVVAATHEFLSDDFGDSALVQFCFDL